MNVKLCLLAMLLNAKKTPVIWCVIKKNIIYLEVILHFKNVSFSNECKAIIIEEYLFTYEITKCLAYSHKYALSLSLFSLSFSFSHTFTQFPAVVVIGCVSE